jgi:hypothetical protein
MTNIPTPPAPLQPNYASAPVGTAPRRPTSVIVLAIIGILIGGLTTLCTPVSLIFMVVSTGIPNPLVDAMKTDPMLMAWTWFSAIVAIVLGALLLGSSIGALIMKRWGRAGMALYGIIQTTLTIATTVANFVWIQPRMNAVMAQTGMPTQRWQQAIGWGLAALMLCYQISCWYVFTRPHIIDAYDAAEASSV